VGHEVDLPMELHGDQPEVVGVFSLRRGSRYGTQLCYLSIRRFPGGPAGRPPVKYGHQEVGFRELFRPQRHHYSLLAALLHKTFMRQLLQGIAHRHPAGTKAVTEIILYQVSAGSNSAVDDVVAQPYRDLLTQV